MGAVRPPAVAGSFYPADAGRLRAAVDGYLAAANASDAAATPKALIAPHAGYVYSGPVAGCAFAALGAGAAAIPRAVAVGPAHFVSFRGIAVPGAAAFRTPLGEVPLDRAAIETLRDLLLVGEATAGEVAQVLERLWGGPETLIVISSDLSHYEPYGRAKEHDAVTAAAIERLDAASLGPRKACGWLPVGALLVAAARHGMRVARLDLRNSGDTAGPKDQVVGYGAWAFCET
jgi:predicted class III extradiol MEMO1 family dioxygenase